MSKDAARDAKVAKMVAELKRYGLTCSVPKRAWFTQVAETLTALNTDLNSMIEALEKLEDGQDVY